MRKKNEINERYNFYYNGNTDKEINEENGNGELVKDYPSSMQNEFKRNLSDYVKKYKPATKVKKINDNNKDIEIYFSEKSDKNFFTSENG